MGRSSILESANVFRLCEAVTISAILGIVSSTFKQFPWTSSTNTFSFERASLHSRKVFTNKQRIDGFYEKQIKQVLTYTLSSYRYSFEVVSALIIIVAGNFIEIDFYLRGGGNSRYQLDPKRFIKGYFKSWPLNKTGTISAAKFTKQKE